MRIKLYQNGPGDHRISLFADGASEPMFQSTKSYRRRSSAKRDLLRFVSMMHAEELRLYDERWSVEHVGLVAVEDALTSASRAARHVRGVLPDSEEPSCPIQA